MSETGADDKGMYFAKLLLDAIQSKRNKATVPADSVWLADKAIDPLTGKKALTRQSASELLTEPRKGALATSTERALAHLLWDDDDSVIYIAVAISRGSRPPKGKSAWAQAIPSYIDQLPEGYKSATSSAIYYTARAYGLTD